MPEKKTCAEKECVDKPKYNIKGQKPKFCLLHKKDNMIDTKRIICTEKECTTRANFNLPGLKKPIYCSLHKKPI